ncbi:MAG: hypothetical protein K1000chlam3_00644 [Chlamydiae bacterium]|nr:hypothetical protein [Chlamydiota bacterium]
MTVRPFYIEQLESNYYGLESLMHKSEAISEITALSKNSKFIQKPNKDIPYFNRWHVVWITLTRPFYSVLSIFSSAISLMAYCLYLPKVARVFTVLSKQMTRDWEELCSQWEFDSLLIPSFNTHQFKTWDLYQYGDVPYDWITDEMVKPLTYPSTAFKNGVKGAIDAFYQTLEETRFNQGWIAWMYNFGRTVGKEERITTNEEFLSEYKTSTKEAINSLKKKYSFDQIEEPINALYEKLKETEIFLQANSSISLFSDRGSCRGGSLWFIFLYHKTRHLFNDPAKHLMAVAQQFTSGMPRQAALLQAFNESEDLLKLEKFEFPKETVSLYELDHNLERAKGKIGSLPTGIYRVGTYQHSLVYVKLSEDEQYVWNPEFGLYPMKGEEMLKMIQKHHYKSGDPGSMIYFHQYETAKGFEPYEGK